MSCKYNPESKIIIRCVLAKEGRGLHYVHASRMLSSIALAVILPTTSDYWAWERSSTTQYCMHT